MGSERVIYFADPIFREYRQSGNIAVRDVWRACMERLIGKARFGTSLPTTVNVYPLRRDDDLLLTLLHYVPIRKAMDIDVIEERGTFAGESLDLPKEATSVRIFGGEELPRSTDGRFALPSTKGRLLLEVSGFFA